MLSNFLWPKDGRNPHDDRPAVLRPARPDELESAVRLILAPAGASGSAHEQHVEDFLNFVRSRGIDFDLIWVAEANGKLVQAALPVVSPGRTMLIFAPPRAGKTTGKSGGRGKGAKENDPDDLLRRLVENVCRSAARKDIHLAQALLDPQEEAMRAVYAGAGFGVMAELHYMQTAVKADLPDPPLPPGYRWQTYSPATHALFARAILQSYRDSLDCPSLNGLRHIDDIITGHQASGYFDPQTWFVLLESPEPPAGQVEAGEEDQGRPLAVLLLSVSPRTDVVELVYLGLSPEARGRSIGQPGVKVAELTMNKALAAVARAGLGRLALAVDSRNVPALKLYYRHGLQRIGAKLALMRDLRGAGVRKFE